MGIMHEAAAATLAGHHGTAAWHTTAAAVGSVGLDGRHLGRQYCRTDAGSLAAAAGFEGLVDRSAVGAIPLSPCGHVPDVSQQGQLELSKGVWHDCGGVDLNG